MTVNALLVREQSKCSLEHSYLITVTNGAEWVPWNSIYYLSGVLTNCMPDMHLYCIYTWNSTVQVLYHYQSLCWTSTTHS